MNCAVGTYGTKSNARCCTASAAFFELAASVAANHASRNSSIFASSGHPNHAFCPLPRTAKLVAGDITSGPTSHVWKIDQPPLSIGSFDEDRKSTRLNSSHPSISYAVFCLKKKKKHSKPPAT